MRDIRASRNAEYRVLGIEMLAFREEKLLEVPDVPTLMSPSELNLGSAWEGISLNQGYLPGAPRTTVFWVYSGVPMFMETTRCFRRSVQAVLILFKDTVYMLSELQMADLWVQGLPVTSN